jgi:hypothetical protein
MPGKTNEETAVVAEVCRPPRLRLRQQGRDVRLERRVCTEESALLHPMA